MKARPHPEINGIIKIPQEDDDSRMWYEPLVPEEVLDIITKQWRKTEKGYSQRIQLPIFKSTEIFVDQIREARPDLYKRNLDVHRHLHKVALELFKYLFYSTKKLKHGETYDFHVECQKILQPSVYLDSIETEIKGVIDAFVKGHLSRKTGQPRDKSRDKLRDILPEKYHDKFLEMWDEMINNDENTYREKERLRKQEYRKRQKIINFPDV